MPFQIVPLPAPLHGVLGSAVVAQVPAGVAYVLPATLQPMLLFVLQGALDIQQPQGAWQRVAACTLDGPCRSTRTARALPGTRVAMVAVQPGQLPRLLGLSASGVAHALVALDALAPPALVARLGAQLHEAASPAAQMRAVQALLCALRAQQAHRRSDMPAPAPALPVAAPADLAAASGLGLRQWERLFVRSHGHTWRQWQQQARCSRMLARFIMGQRGVALPWAHLAAEAGYFDQAHLVRDMRRFTGYTPAQLGRQLALDDPALWPYRLHARQLQQVFGAALF